MQKFFLFDFFGVLCDDPHLIWLRDKGLLGQVEDLIKKYYQYSDVGTMSSQELYAHLAEVSGMTAAEVESEVKGNIRIDSEVEEIIRSLKPFYTVGLCSNAQQGFVEEILKDHSLIDLFDTTVISSRVGLRKPDKEIFLHALSMLGAKPSETIFIDDNESYLPTAIEMGFSAFVFSSAQQLREDLHSIGIKV
ncbi:HAD family phosphatase [Patescibacteria group bacterium]|nr:HAD family phosphatase [Patescibacteria group bacterium]MBU2220429.1 HAD family phosphatase [Patescibacteria group bacterium]